MYITVPGRLAVYTYRFSITSQRKDCKSVYAQTNRDVSASLDRETLKQYQLMTVTQK